MTLENITSLSAFNDIARQSLMVVHFAAEWLPQSKQIDEVMTELASQQDLKNIRFCRVEAENVADLSAKFNVSFAPTCVLLAHGKTVGRVEGVKVSELAKKVRSLCLQGDVVTIEPSAVIPDLRERLKSLINKAECMLFMKGSPDQPRCGFSRQIIEIFNKNNAVFSTFDILTDEEVRQGLKSYSDWPTYPQVYVKGELIGGLDIIKEMDSSGELASVLPCSKSPAEIDERLRKLTTSSPVMVFMKGTRDQPRCGFSRQLMEILTPFKLDMKTFDILTDEMVRQELKRFADFPTYPQLWVKGELVGGLDIVKELKQSGELESVLGV